MTDTDNQAITIHSNGSKWRAAEPDTVESLLLALAEHPLDRTFEIYGDFIYQSDDGKWWAFGNFLDLSHVFRIEADSRDELAEIEAAIRANQQRDDYLAQPVPVRKCVRPGCCD